MRRVRIFLPNGEILEYQKGVGEVIGIYDDVQSGFPVVRIVFDDNSFLIYKNCPFELKLPPKRQTDEGGYHTRPYGNSRFSTREWNGDANEGRGIEVS